MAEEEKKPDRFAESKRREDKIFGNDFNTGSVEFEFFGKIKMSEPEASSGSEFHDNSYTHWEKQQLREELYEIFENSTFREKYSRIKKVPKNEMVKIYYYFADQLTKEKYTAVQTFTEIAEFMKMNYKDMFHQLLPIDKQLIIQELNEDYNVLDKRKIKRLF